MIKHLSQESRDASASLPSGAGKALKSPGDPPRNAPWRVWVYVESGSGQRRALGDTSRVPDQSWAALMLLVCERPAVCAASPMSLGSTWPSRPALGVRSQIWPPSASGGERVGQGVEQIAVVVAPPQQHDVDHVLVVLVDQLALRRPTRWSRAAPRRSHRRSRSPAPPGSA